MKAALPAPSGLPAALALQPGEALPVNHQLSLCHDGEILYYFLGIAPIACHHRDDKRARNLCLARCALFQLASLVDLARPFGLSPRTILRARQTLERDGEMGFAPRQRTRRRHAIQDPEVLERAARLLADGASLRHTARQLALCFETLRTYQRRGLLPPVPPDPASAATQAPPVAAKPCSPPTATPVRSTPPVRPPQQAAGTDSPPPLDRVQRDHRDAQARQGRATHDTPGRLAASLGDRTPREPRFPTPATAVAGAGVLAALPALLAEGLLTHAGKLSVPPGYYGLRSILLTLAFLFLLRVQRVERLASEPPGEWGLLLGLDRSPCPRTLRRHLRQLAADPEALRAWSGALTQHWATTHQDALATLFVDGHVQVYSGQGAVPKRFVPRQKLCLAGATSYWVHALGGAPLLCLHKALDHSLGQEIRHSIIPQLQQLGVLSKQGDPQRPQLTLVFDREGWSPALFAALRRQGIAVISWRKGAQTERWPLAEFTPVQLDLPGPLGTVRLQGQAAEREVELGAHGTVREVRFRIDRRLPIPGRSGQPRQPVPRSGAPDPDQRQPAAITTHPSLPPAQVASLLRSRWTQENFFKYMRAEYALDTLASHTLEDVDADEQMVNPQWRWLDNAVQRQLGTLHRQLAQAPRGSDVAQQLRSRVQDTNHRLEGLQIARREVDHHVRVGDLPADERPQTLGRPLRELCDTLRMLVYRAETRLAAVLAPQLSRPETARLQIKALLRSAASLLPDPVAGTLTVRLLHQPTRAQDRALAPLLDALNQTRTLYPGTTLRLVYELPPCNPSDPSQPQPNPAIDSTA